MDIFLYNFDFIWFNSFLALISVLLGWLMHKTSSKYLRVFYIFSWLIFLPNTLYILTDITHLFEVWAKLESLFKLLLIIQYALFSILGILTFIYSIYLFQELLEGKSRSKKKKRKITTFISILIINFMVGFAMMLGGIQRTNSWDVVTNPGKVINDVFTVLSSREMMILSLGFGIIANIIYFYFEDPVVKWGNKYLKR